MSAETEKTETPPNKETPPRPDTLWITDAEMIRRLGVPEKIARAAIRMLDAQHRNTGFPQKKALWGRRRYWPAVKAWLDRDNNLPLLNANMRSSANPTWTENFDALPDRARKHKRPV